MPDALPRVGRISDPDVGEELLSRIQAALDPPARTIIGIAGPPGSGKSTLAEALALDLRERGLPTAHVPMDGFHLANVELARLGRLDRKGAPDTFDGAGYAALLARARAATTDIVYAPSFERTLEQPIAGVIPILPETQVIVTEGNYLLDAADPWRRLVHVLTQTWWCEVPDATRREWLVRRHIEFGKSPDAARRWVTEVDEVNARRIQTGRPRADRIIAIGQRTGA